jgi:hypothetical protein
MKSENFLNILGYFWVAVCGLFVVWLVANGAHEFLKPSAPTTCQSLAQMPSDSKNPDQQGMVGDCFTQNQP